MTHELGAPTSIRLMRPTERGAVRNLGVPLFAELGGYREALDGWLRHPGVVTVVAGSGGTAPRGFALVGRITGEHAAYLLALGVAPGARRRGLGRALLLAALEEARRRAARWGVDSILLDVAEDNAPGRALFSSCGFAPLGAGQPYAEGQRSVRMGRPLQVGTTQGTDPAS